MNPALRESLACFLEQADDPVEGALIVTRIVDADAEVNWARDEIASIAATMNTGGVVPPEDVVAELSERGFQGAGQRYYEIENSLLDHVLRSRRGIPISLGVVLMGVARQLGLPASGINFPRHFLVTIGNLLVDPYAMAPASIDTCRAWLKENRVAEEGAFAIAAPRDIVLRMLNNVRLLVQSRGDFARALEVSDYQLLIVPDDYGLHVERADAWLGLNAPEMVVRELEKATEHAPDAATAARLRERIAQARRLKSMVN